MASEILRYRNSPEQDMPCSGADYGAGSRLEPGHRVERCRSGLWRCRQARGRMDGRRTAGTGPRSAADFCHRSSTGYEAYLPGEDQHWPQKHWKEPLAMANHDVRTNMTCNRSARALLRCWSVQRATAAC